MFLALSPFKFPAYDPPQFSIPLSNMYPSDPDDRSDQEAAHALAVQDPGRAWYLGRIQTLRDLQQDVLQMGKQGDQRGKTAGEMAVLLAHHLEQSAEDEWEGYVQLAGSRSPTLAAALRQAGPPIRSSMVHYPAEQLRLPTAYWGTLTVESGGLWTCPGDGTNEGFTIAPLFAPEPKPDPTDDCLVIPLMDRRHVATAALYELLCQFRRDGQRIIAPCQPEGAWRRLKYLSQHYRQAYQVGMDELPADELVDWDKGLLVNLPLAEAAMRISALANTGMAIRLLALGSVTVALSGWIRQIDAARPDQIVSMPQEQLLASTKQWASIFDLTLQSMNSALLLEREMDLKSWETRVIQRPFPGSVPILEARRKG